MAAPRSRTTSSIVLAGLVVFVLIVALIVMVVSALRGGSSSSDGAPSASSSTTVDGPEQQGGPTRSADPSGSASTSPPNPMASLPQDKYATAQQTADGFMKAWATKYGSRSQRTSALSKWSTKQLADLSGSTDESRLPDPSKVGEGTVDKKHSTVQTPVVKYDVDGEIYWILLQEPGPTDSNARSGEYVVSQNLANKDFRRNYESITPQPAYSGEGG